MDFEYGSIKKKKSTSSLEVGKHFEKLSAKLLRQTSLEWEEWDDFVIIPVLCL
jgi:hypothetical protein